METKAPTNRAQSGVTIVEMAVAVGVMSFILVGTIAVSSTVRDGARTTAMLSRLDQESGRTLDQIAADLMQGGLATLTPPDDGDSTVMFRRCTGFADGDVVWGPQVSITLEPEPGDPDDGVDNDGDGLVDECQIVRRTNPGTANEVAVVLARGVSEFAAGETEDGDDNDGDGLVDEPGLVFSLDGSTLSIELTMVGWDRATGTMVQSISTSITFRN